MAYINNIIYAYADGRGKYICGSPLHEAMGILGASVMTFDTLEDFRAHLKAHKKWIGDIEVDLDEAIERTAKELAIEYHKNRRPSFADIFDEVRPGAEETGVDLYHEVIDVGKRLRVAMNRRKLTYRTILGVMLGSLTIRTVVADMPYDKVIDLWTEVSPEIFRTLPQEYLTISLSFDVMRENED
tara:strand:- start:526 stop:1080 length:555 start_codon:yes stop_codon:yes gene_type:complete